MMAHSNRRHIGSGGQFVHGGLRTPLDGVEDDVARALLGVL